MDIYEDARTVPRSDLAAWLRQLANQLESDGRIFYGAAGAVSVADTVRCELEIERESETELSVEIEFSWTVPAPTSAQAVDQVEEPSNEDAQAEATPDA
ncbi:amphi-Trp domain-containing protein [Micromonospora sp. B9E7]|uniref:amphi-Trp domain-containing protein n=1 Tax=Micromonospora sp. B9E7 TaxID=3153574 RepID=UPI00325FDB47